MNWLDWDKLKREWKTVALAVVWFLVESYDAVAAFMDVPGLFPADWQWWMRPAFPILMLLLRKWKDSDA